MKNLNFKSLIPPSTARWTGNSLGEKEACLSLQEITKSDKKPRSKLAKGQSIGGGRTLCKFAVAFPKIKSIKLKTANSPCQCHCWRFIRQQLVFNLGDFSTQRMDIARFKKNVQS